MPKFCVSAAEHNQWVLLQGLQSSSYQDLKPGNAMLMSPAGSEQVTWRIDWALHKTHTMEILWILDYLLGITAWFRNTKLNQAVTLNVIPVGLSKKMLQKTDTSYRSFNKKKNPTLHKEGKVKCFFFFLDDWLVIAFFGTWGFSSQSFH